MRCSILLVLAMALGMFSFRKDKTTTYKFPQLTAFPPMPVAVDNPVTVDGVELGRFLFYDTILSKDGTLSCASCHKQENAFSGAPEAFNKGFSGALQKRNTLPLFNLAWHPRLFWDGRVHSIEEQAFHPVRTHDEMNLDWEEAARRVSTNRFYKAQFQKVFPGESIDSITIAKAIAQFERTLLSYRSKFDAFIAGKATLTQEEAEGFEIINDMTRGDCLHCHSTDADALGTTLAFSNNGLDTATIKDSYPDKGMGTITHNDADNGKFKIPSLRNLSFTAPYMHDGRFKTLEEVMAFYSSGVKNSVNIDSKMGAAHKGGVQLNKEEQQKVIAFLKTLNDTAFIIDPAFSNPFKNKR